MANEVGVVVLARTGVVGGLDFRGGCEQARGYDVA